MKLKELNTTDVTDVSIFFNIKIEYFNWLGMPKTRTYDCYRDLIGSRSHFIGNGDLVFRKWSYIDNSINAILSTKSKSYKQK